MNGLEEILSAIEGESRKQTDRIAEDARKSAEEKAAAARSSAEKEAERIIASAEKAAAQTAAIAESGGESYIKKQLLAVRSNAVAERIKNTKEKLNSLNGAKYYDLIEKLIIKYAAAGEGELIMSRESLENLPEDFLSRVNSEIGKHSASVKIGPTKEIGKGFVLRYGDIEENCTFDALIDDKTDEIKDRLYKLLES